MSKTAPSLPASGGSYTRDAEGKIVTPPVKPTVKGGEKPPVKES